MCENLIIHDGEKIFEVRTEAELFKFLYAPIPPDSNHCLCNTHLKGLASKYGYKYSKLDEENKFDPFDCHWYKV